MSRIPERRRGRSDDALRQIRQELERAWDEDHAPSGILLVDCVPADRDAYVDYLTRADLHPVVECDAQSAFATAVAMRPRIVIVDSVLAEASGFELGRRLRRHGQTRDALIVLLVDASDECASVGRRAGADVRVVKRCSPAQVVSAIVEYLRRQIAPGESSSDRAPGVDSPFSSR